MFNNSDDNVDGFHDSSVEDPNVNTLPKLPKAAEQDDNKTWHESRLEYFNTPPDETASSTEQQAASQPFDKNSLGKKGNEKPLAAQTNNEQPPAKELEVLPPWLSLVPKKSLLFIDPQLLAMHLVGPTAPNPLRFVSYPGSNEQAVFIYRDGFYQKVTQRYLRGYVKSFLPPEHRSKYDIEKVLYELNTELSTLTDDVVDGDEDIINFENGLLHLSSWSLTEHTSDILSTVRIPCEFNPDLTLEDAPVFSSFLNDLTSGDDIDQTFILEYIGAILSNVPGYRFKKLLILYGPGDTGKSQLRDLVEWLIGPQNHHTIDLTKLGERFGTSQIYGKRLAGSGDMSFAKIKEIAALKELTGGDNINAEYKGKDAFTFRFRGFLWYNCNDLPQFSGDRGRHVYERFCIVRCGNVIPPEKQDRLLLSKMKAEKAAIVSSALRHFKAAVERGYKFTESESMVNLRDQYAERNNSAIAFVRECCDITQGRTKRSEVYNAYKAWCKYEHLYEEPKSSFMQTLAVVFGITAYKSGEYYLPLTLKPNIRLSFSNYC